MEAIQEAFERMGAGLDNLTELIPLVLAEPRDYPREAMLLATTAALAVLLLVLIGVAIADTLRHKGLRRELGFRSSSARRTRMIVIPVAVVFVVSLVLSLAPLVPSVGGACNVCHGLDEAVATWDAGTHGDVSCYGCHAQPGVAGALGASVSGASRRLVGGRDDAGEVLASGGSVHEAGCISCHESILEEVVGETVNMQHAEPVEAGMRCGSCHALVGHEDALFGVDRLDRATMSLCLACHDGTTAPDECDVCHFDAPLDSVEASAPAGQTAALRITCSGCHSAQTEADCITCHGLELPHPPAFMGDHAGMAYRDPGLCARCHELVTRAETCACHFTTNVHGTYSEWFPRHGPAAKKNGRGGCMCHDLIFCEYCHDSSPF